MVFYEMHLIVKPMTKPFLVEALKRACKAVWDHNGVVLKLENLGYRDLPWKMGPKGLKFTTGSQIMVLCNMPIHCFGTTYSLLKANNDIIHHHLQQVDLEEEIDFPPCTLYDEQKPPAYRTNVADAKRLQFLIPRTKVKMARNLRRGPKRIAKAYPIGPWRQ